MNRQKCSGCRHDMHARAAVSENSGATVNGPSVEDVEADG